MTGASGWRIDAHRVLALEPWCLMGILNVTPDSFSDGGVHLDPEHAVESGVEMTRRGASVLDIGGGYGRFSHRAALAFPRLQA